MSIFPEREKIVEIVNKYGHSKERLIQILLELREASGRNCISRECAAVVAQELGLPLTKVYDVVTFYSMLGADAKGKYIIEICKSAPCHVNNVKSAVSIFESLLGIKMGQTTADGMFTLEYSSCFGGCDVAPAVKIGEKVYGELNEQKAADIINSLRGV